MSPYTPGPWTILRPAPAHPDYWEVRTNENRAIVALGEQCFSPEVEAANARLIAAAPDLLDAAKDALVALAHGENGFHTRGDTSPRCQFCQSMSLLAAAIAKAQP